MWGPYHSLWKEGIRGMRWRSPPRMFTAAPSPPPPSPTLKKTKKKRDSPVCTVQLPACRRVLTALTCSASPSWPLWCRAGAAWTMPPPQALNCPAHDAPCCAGLGLPGRCGDGRRQPERLLCAARWEGPPPQAMRGMHTVACCQWVQAAPWARRRSLNQKCISRSCCSRADCHPRYRRVTLVAAGGGEQGGRVGVFRGNVTTANNGGFASGEPSRELP